MVILNSLKSISVRISASISSDLSRHKPTVDLKSLARQYNRYGVAQGCTPLLVQAEIMQKNNAISLLRDNLFTLNYHPNAPSELPEPSNESSTSKLGARCGCTCRLQN
jgi:hypothetical protein